MDNRFDSIRTKINKLRKIIIEFESRQQKLELENKSDTHVKKRIAKQGKRKIILYDEIPQEVLNKSYRIFKSSRLLERYYMKKFFSKWSKFISQKYFTENIANSSEKINNSNLNENEIIISNDTENKLIELAKPLGDTNTESTEGLDEHTEDGSKISFHISDEEYSDENM